MNRTETFRTELL